MDFLISANWRDQVKYGLEKPDPQILADDGQVRVILGGLRAGQAIPIHAEEKAVYHFLEGAGQMFVNDQSIAIAPDITVFVPKGAKRGMRADTQLAFIAVRVT